MGRRDDLFKVNGQWISPLEIESVLHQHPKVLEVAVVPESNGGDSLTGIVAYISLKSEHKEKALEWIDRLEEEPRGIYAGGIGWVNSRGEADIAIAIRSAYQYGDCKASQRHRIHLNAGAGIVAESVPQYEYIESANKMNTMLNNLVLKNSH